MRGAKESGTVSIRKIAEYSGVWVHWVLQKDANLGIMRIYKNGVLFEEGFDRTRPMGAEVDAFKVGASRYQGNWWKGLLDEFRIGLFMESSDSILASYQSQNPSGAEVLLHFPASPVLPSSSVVNWLRVMPTTRTEASPI